MSAPHDIREAALLKWSTGSGRELPCKLEAAAHLGFREGFDAAIDHMIKSAMVHMPEDAHEGMRCVGHVVKENK